MSLTLIHYFLTESCISFEFLGVATMRVKKRPQSVKKDCLISLENVSVAELQSFHLEHSLQSACRDCRKHYLDSLANVDIVRCPYCR